MSGPPNDRPPAASAEGRPHLVFELREEGLAVRDAELRMLKAYASPSAVPDEEQQAGASPATVAAPPSPASPPVPARRPTREPIQLQFPQRERIARLPEEVKTADFIHYRGHMLVATSDGTSILVFHADERMSPVASVKPTTPGEILSVRWWIPEDKGSPLLIVNVWKGDRPEGAIFALRENRLESVRETVFYILAPFDRDGDGRRELLLGQSFDRERFFGPRVRQLTLRGHELKTSEPSFRLPRDFTIQAATFADLTGDGLPELAFIRSNILYLYGPDGELLWRSGATVGGSPSALTYEIDPSLEFSPVNTVPFELTPVAADLNGDGVGELIVVAGELRSVSAPGLDPGAKKSWLAVLAFRDQAFVMGKLGPEFDVPMQGLAFDESRLLLITPESHAVSFFGKSSPSHLLALSLH